jgi:F-type H+-transporting ATPase subunit delta
MAHDPLNTGYARGLLAMAQAEQAVERVLEELFRLRELLKTNPDLFQFLKDPGVKPEGKRRALAELFQGRVHPLVLNFLLTLNDLDRSNRVLAIIEDFETQAATARQKVTGEVVSAPALDPATVLRFAAELSRLTGKNVELFQKVDPAILGGAIIKVGEQVIDGSLRRRLDQIKEKLAK